MPVKFELKVDKKYLDAIDKQCQKAIVWATQETLEEFKDSMQMAASSSVPVYEEYGGPLDEVFQKTGLDNVAVRKTRLLEAVTQTIEAIKSYARFGDYRNIQFSIFRTDILQQKTRWIGLTRDPLLVNKNGKISFHDKDNFPTYDDSGRMPNLFENSMFSQIIGGKVQPAKWYSNPAPGWGYWASIDEGWVSPKTGFINAIWGVLLDGSLEARNFNPIGFNSIFMSRLNNNLGTLLPRTL